MTASTTMDGGLRVEMDGNVSLPKPAVLFMRSSFSGPFWDLDVTYRPEKEAASAIESFLYSKPAGLPTQIRITLVNKLVGSVGQ